MGTGSSTSPVKNETVENFLTAHQVSPLGWQRPSSKSQEIALGPNTIRMRQRRRGETHGQVGLSPEVVDTIGYDLEAESSNYGGWLCWRYVYFSSTILGLYGV